VLPTHCYKHLCKIQGRGQVTVLVLHHDPSLKAHRKGKSSPSGVALSLSLYLYVKPVSSIGKHSKGTHRSKHASRHWIAPYAAVESVMMDLVGGERTTCASTASSLKLRRANALRLLTH
jgi:hypothetical protein